MSPRAASPLTTEYILLGLLALQPMHGYELYKQVGERPGLALIWRVKQSQLYALLDKLEQEHLVASQQIPNDPRPPRKEYHLTDAGRQAFLAWRLSPVQRPREIRQEFMARLYFAHLAGVNDVCALLTAQRAICTGWQANFEALAARQKNTGDTASAIAGYRLSQARAILEWLDACLETLAA